MSKSTLSKFQERLHEVPIGGANLTNNSESPNISDENLNRNNNTTDFGIRFSTDNEESEHLNVPKEFKVGGVTIRS